MNVNFQTIKATANKAARSLQRGAKNLYAEVKNPTQSNRIYWYGAGGVSAGLILTYLGIKASTHKLEDSFYQSSAKFSRKPIEINSKLDGAIEEVTLKTKDGIDLDCWDINPNNSNKYAIFMHGNCRNIGDEQELYSELVEKGFGVFALEYRGYANNKGKINEKGLNIDAQTAYDYLLEKGIEPKNIGAIGHSLGGAIACDLASKNELGFVVLDSTFNNARDSIRTILNHEDVKARFSAPKRAIVSALPIAVAPINNKFESDKKIKNVTCPILVIHCKDDDVIPYSLSKKLAANATRAQYLEFATLGDSSIHNLTTKEIDKIVDFAQRTIKSDETANTDLNTPTQNNGTDDNTELTALEAEDNHEEVSDDVVVDVEPETVEEDGLVHKHDQDLDEAA